MRIIRCIWRAALLSALTAPVSAQESQLTPFKVGMSDAVNTVLPLWMAQAGGFFAAQGLKVELINMGGGSRGAAGAAGRPARHHACRSVLGGAGQPRGRRPAPDRLA